MPILAHPYGCAILLDVREVPVADVSPKDRFVTVYGRKPVLEALADDGLSVDKVVLADTARGPAAREILDAARARGVQVQRASAQRVKVLAGNGKQDQGVLADVVAPRMRTLAAALPTAGRPRPSCCWTASPPPPTSA